MKTPTAFGCGKTGSPSDDILNKKGRKEITPLALYPPGLQFKSEAA